MPTPKELQQLRDQVARTQKDLEELQQSNLEDRMRADAKDPKKLLAATPLGQQVLADRKAKEEAEAAKHAAQVVQPTDKYLEMTSVGQAALQARKEGKL